MSVNPIDVRAILQQYPTLEAAQKANKSGKFSDNDYNRFILELNKPEFKEASAAFYGLESADAAPLTPEQKEAKDKAKAAQQQEIADAKKAAAKNPTLDRVRREGVRTEEGVVTSHGNGTFTFDIKAPTRKKEKTSRGAEQARMARYYDEKSGQWIELQEGESMRDLSKRLKAKEKELKAEKKAAKKQLKADRKDQNVSVSELREDNRRLAEAREELNQAKQARKASVGKGIKGDTRAFNRNVKANNRLVDREVYFDKAAAKAASESPEGQGKTIKVASKDDIAVLRQLAATAQMHLDDKNSSPQQKALWTELANLFKDENGNDIKQPDTRKVQDALIDLTGGDMRLNYTEQKAISKELGMSMADVRSAFKTYGFEAPNPIGKRVTNGLIAAAPAAAAVTMSWLLSRTHIHAEATAEAHAHAEATAKASGSVTATAETEGIAFDWTDPYTGEEIHKRIAGDSQTVTEYFEAIDTAVADKIVPATAVIDGVVRLGKKALVAAPAIAFLAGFAKKPVEISAAQQGINTQKMATYVEVFKNNKNKNIGNQIVQMAGHITGDEAVDRAIIVAVLDHDIGSQNTNPRTRELRNALAHLDAIKAEVEKFKNLPPREEEPAQPVPEPTPEPDKYCYQAKPGEVVKPNTHTVAKGDTVDMIIKAKYPDSNFRKAKAEFLKANPDLKDPNSIQVGQEFILPDVDGKAPKLDGKVRQAHGKKIVFRPSNIPSVNGEQMYDVFDCSDPQNEKKLNQRPMTKQAAEAEETRLAAEAQQQGKVPRK